MATKRFIYATNNSQIHYRFLIIDETENEYICSDYDTLSFELKSVRFYIDKITLNGRVGKEDEKWAFIVTEGWFASLNEEDVFNEERKRNIVVINEAIKAKKEDLEKLSQLDVTINENYKAIDFNNLQINDALFLLDDNDNILLARVVKFITENKIDFIPVITCEEVNAYDVEVEFDSEKKEYFINVYNDGYYEDYVNEKYLIFKDTEDCHLYLQNKERKSLIKRINSIKNSINELDNRLNKLQSKTTSSNNN